MDEAELAAGRVQVGEASILWHIEVDIEVDIEASEGLDVAAWSLLEASRPPVDLSGTCCSGPLDHVSTTIAYFRSQARAHRATMEAPPVELLLSLIHI